MARPRKEIDKREFEKLCGYQSTQQEICWWFGVTDKTLNAWCKRTYHMSFSEVFAQKRGMGLISLRRMQFQLAEKSAAMAIFLGKQHLGQQDVQKQEITGANGGPVETLATKVVVYLPDNGRDNNGD
nr:MAG TPA: DNA-packaging protein small subunit [Caudoviricetes sp.]